MKCTNKKISLILYVALLCMVLTACSLSSGGASTASKYARENYNKSLYKGESFAKDLCVTDKDISTAEFLGSPELESAGLFDLKKEKVAYASNIHKRLYPASTTKVMTGYLALKYGNLDDIVTVSEAAVDFAPDEQVCGLEMGNMVTLHDLLNGLILFSGNDAAVAIAEHISGSVEAFSSLMNQEAVALGATNTNFVNPHGLHNENQYTTAYDLYLMFNASIKDQRFLDIISKKSYIGTLTDGNDVTRTLEWFPTNYYSLGAVSPPLDITVFGGKTGTTDEAGSCLILYSQNALGNPYISIIMGAPDKQELYSQMSALISVGA